MMLNTNRLLIALIVGFALSPLVQAQLKTFKPGDVIKSSEINENFEYLEEQIGSAGDAASAQCSASQDGNNVVISCTDGSSGLLAGSGTVVVFSEGVIGESMTASVPAGAVVFVDSADVVLGEVFAGSSPPRIKLGIDDAGLAFSGMLINVDAEQRVALFPATWNNNTARYLEADCSGSPFIVERSEWFGLVMVEDVLYARKEKVSDQALFKGKRASAYWNGTVEEFGPTGDCVQEDFVGTAFATGIYTPSQEIRDAAYPVRLEQLP